MLGGLAFGEKQQIGFNAGVGVKDAIWQTHNGMQVAIFQQFFFEAGFHAFAKEKAVGQDHSSTPLVFEQVNNERHKQVCGFAGTEGGREVVFDAIFFHATKGRVGDDDVDAVFVGIVPQRPAQRVVMLNIGGGVNAMQNHVGDAEHMRQGFFVNAINGGLQDFFIGW